jgi:hypothetical protein
MTMIVQSNLIVKKSRGSLTILHLNQYYIKYTLICMNHLKYCIVRYSPKNWCKKFYDFSRLSFEIYRQKYVSRNFLLFFNYRMTTSIETWYWLRWSIVNEPLDFLKVGKLGQTDRLNFWQPQQNKRITGPGREMFALQQARCFTYIFLYINVLFSCTNIIINRCA